MASEREELIIDGNELNLEADWAQQSQSGGLGQFLTRHASRYPWFFGIAAITIMTVYPESGQATVAQVTGNICVALITIHATWRRSSNERERTTELSRVS